MKNTTNLYAVYSCLVAATLWGLYWIPLRYLENSGISGLWASLLIYAVAFFFVFPRFFKLRADFYASKTLYILLAIFAGWTNLAFVRALLEGEVVRVMILFYLSPVWATLLAFFILNEDLKKQNKPRSKALKKKIFGGTSDPWEGYGISLVRKIFACGGLLTGF